LRLDRGLRRALRRLGRRRLFHATAAGDRKREQDETNLSRRIRFHAFDGDW